MEDKQRQLIESAHRIFKDKGFRQTSVSDITKEAGMAVGSFYRYFDSKTDIFLKVHQRENKLIKDKIQNDLDWDKDPVEILEDLMHFIQSLQQGNKITGEWNNPELADLLRNQYYGENKIESNSFAQYLDEKIRDRMKSLHFSEDKIQEFMEIIQLFYFLDAQSNHITIPNYSQRLITLIKYFIKGYIQGQ